LVNQLGGRVRVVRCPDHLAPDEAVQHTVSPMMPSWPCTPTATVKGMGSRLGLLHNTSYFTQQRATDLLTCSALPLPVQPLPLLAQQEAWARCYSLMGSAPCAPPSSPCLASTFLETHATRCGVLRLGSCLAHPGTQQVCSAIRAAAPCPVKR
jgi:hypothetical protein